MGIGPPPPIPPGGEGGAVRRVEPTADRRHSARDEARHRGEGEPREDLVEVGLPEGDPKLLEGALQEAEPAEPGLEGSPPRLDIEA